MGDPRDELRERAKDDGIEFFFAMFVDMHGKPCAKLIPAASYDEVLMGGGAGFAGFAAGPMGQSPADPDMISVPDPASYTLTPWQPGLAVLQCDIHVEGEPWPYAPRLILKRMLEKPPGWTGSTAVSIPVSRIATTCTSCRPRRSPGAASAACRRRCCTRRTSWSPTTSCARRSARHPTGIMSTTTRRSSARNSSRGTPW